MGVYSFYPSEGMGGINRALDKLLYWNGWYFKVEASFVNKVGYKKQCVRSCYCVIE